MPAEFNSLSGQFLVSNAMLEDPNFTETVVLMIEHSEEGAFGLTINRPLELGIGDVLPSEFHADFHQEPLYQGGPVGQNNLFFLYGTQGQPPERAKSVCPGVYLGSDYEMLSGGRLELDNVLFFLGYSGWGPGQLEFELGENSWVTMKATKKIVFSANPKETWRNALQNKGGLYSFFAKNVEDPNLN